MIKTTINSTYFINFKPFLKSRLSNDFYLVSIKIKLIQARTIIIMLYKKIIWKLTITCYDEFSMFKVIFILIRFKNKSYENRFFKSG